MSKLNEYQTAKKITSELDLHAEILVQVDNVGNFRKYIKELDGDKEFTTKTIGKKLRVIRLK